MIVHEKMLPVHCQLTGNTQNKILSVCPVINCPDHMYIFCCFIKLRQTFTSTFVFSTSSLLLGVYLKERNHVPETAAWPGPGVGPEFYAVMSRGPGPDPQGDLLHLWEKGGIKNTMCYSYSAFWMSSALKAPCGSHRTSSVEGKDVSITLGRTLGSVRLRAAAGETAGLPPRWAGVFCCCLQLWKRDNVTAKLTF